MYELTSIRVRGIVTIQRQRSETARFAINTFLTTNSISTYQLIIHKYIGYITSTFSIYITSFMFQRYIWSSHLAVCISDFRRIAVRTMMFPATPTETNQFNPSYQITWYDKKEDSVFSHSKQEFHSWLNFDPLWYILWDKKKLLSHKVIDILQVW